MSLKQSVTLVSLKSLFFTLSIFAKEPLVVIISLDDIAFPLVLNEASLSPELDATKQKYLDAINQARSLKHKIVAIKVLKYLCQH